MSLLRVRLVGDQILRQRCGLILDPRPIQRTLDCMLETVISSDGAVALAAPQVGFPYRYFVYAADQHQPKVFINPVIHEREGSREVLEGCLSIPDFYPQITRAERVRGEALDRWGARMEFDEDGLLGHAIQHEIDHLDGVLTLDRMTPEDRQELLERLPPELHRLRKGIRAAIKESQ